jgi:YD repeat-containing protein
MGPATLSSFSYDYYLDGNQAGKTDHTGKATAYTYDSAGRLTGETESGTSNALAIAYAYDASGNRSEMTVSGVQSYEVSYAYDLNNRLTTETKAIGGQAEVTNYFYDRNGNTYAKNHSLLQQATGSEALELSWDVEAAEFYTYDGFNRLVSVTNDAGTSVYAYRPDGLRLSKTVDGVATTHVWDGQYISLELDGTGAVTDRYIRGIGLLASEQNGTYLVSAHGDVVQLSDGTGVVYKDLRLRRLREWQNADPSDANPFRYCGEYLDLSSGTYYLRARDYGSDNRPLLDRRYYARKPYEHL